MKTEMLVWVPIPLWVACASNVLRAGLVQFPDSAFLNLVLGTFEAVLRQEQSVRPRSTLGKDAALDTSCCFSSISAATN